jgi:kinesin family member C1
MKFTLQAHVLFPLHNVLIAPSPPQELRGNVRVFARVRPFLPHEVPLLRSGEEPWLRVDPDGTSIHALAPSSSSPAAGGSVSDNVDITHSFSFDRTFGTDDGQEAVFLEVSEFVQSALDGFNVCLFSYGQTGSGYVLDSLWFTSTFSAH